MKAAEGNTAITPDEASERTRLRAQEVRFAPAVSDTLREIAHTAPSVHDGRFKTLEEVIEFYNQGGIKNPPGQHHHPA